MSGLRAAMTYWQSGGALLVPLALVSVAIWFVFLRTRFQLLRESSRASRMAVNLTQEPTIPPDCSYLIAALSAGDQAVAVFDAKIGHLLLRLRRDFGVLKALTVVAPLLGLLGTVVGMISTFVAVGSGDGDTAVRVADGVSRALITTQVGLVVAIPGVFGQVHLRRLVSQLNVHLGALKLHVLQRTVQAL